MNNPNSNDKNEDALSFVNWQSNKTNSKIVLAIHGYNDYSNAFEKPAKYLSKFGIETIAFDLKGFGRNKNRGKWFNLNSHLEDIKKRLKIIHSQNPNTQIFILGESMGGAIILSFINKFNDLPIEGVILVAPAIWNFSDQNFWKSISLRFFSFIFPNFKISAKGIIKVKASDNIEMLKKLSQDKFFVHKPTFKSLRGIVDLMDESYIDTLEYLNNPKYNSLILLPIKDEIVPRKPFVKMLKRIQKGKKNIEMTEIGIYENHYHMILRDLKTKTVLTDVKNWILNENPKKNRSSLDEIISNLQNFEYYHRLDK